jgi:hypothetical protein
MSIMATPGAGASVATVVTAYGGPLQRELALSAGFDDYVKKRVLARNH